MTATKKTAKTATTKKASKATNAKSAKGGQRTGHAPQSQLDLEETKKLEAARAKTAPGSKNAKAATKKDKPAKPKKVSALDAAATLLASAAEPMNCQALIDAMAAKGLWSSPNGKTPAATLYAAILREINRKGKDARFRKTERGHFAAAKAS